MTRQISNELRFKLLAEIDFESTVLDSSTDRLIYETRTKKKKKKEKKEKKRKNVPTERKAWPVSLAESFEARAITKLPNTPAKQALTKRVPARRARDSFNRISVFKER